MAEKPAQIPLTLSPINLPAQITLGSLRHLLTTIGGYWIALGVTDADQVTLMWGVGLTLAGAAWSWLDKVLGRKEPTAPDAG